MNLRLLPALAVSCLAAAATAQQMPSPATESVLESAGSSLGMLGIGGRLAWIQRPLDDPRLWVDAHAIVRPLPRLFLEGGWGKASKTLRGSGPDTTYSETRWDLAVGIVVLQGSASGYVPAVWRKVSQRHSWLGDASWTEIGTGAGALVPIKDWLALQTETLWITPLDPHRDVEAGQGRETDGSHLEFSLSFVAFIK